VRHFVGRTSILTVAITYLISLLMGAICAHMGITFALAARDRIMNRAFRRDRAAIAIQRGRRFAGAAIDFA